MAFGGAPCCAASGDGRRLPSSCAALTRARPAVPAPQMVQSLGFAIYRALDWGLDESEERELSPQLERLIDLMANNDSEDGGCGAADEGYGGPEEEEEAEGGPRAVRSFAQAMRLCAARLTDPRGAPAHYQAVCRALFLETLELRAFLARVREAKEVSPGWGGGRRRRRGGLTPRWLLPGRGSGQWTADSRGRQGAAACPPVPLPPQVPLSSRKGAMAPGLRSMGCCGYH